MVRTVRAPLRCAAGGSVFGALASDVIIIDTVALLAEHLVFFVHVIETYYVRDADALPTWQAIACALGGVCVCACVHSVREKERVWGLAGHECVFCWASLAR